jgi:hypothetical protein
MCATLGLPVRRYLAATLGPAAAVVTAVSAVQWLGAGWLPADTVSRFVVRAALSMPPALVVAALIATDDERDSVRGVVASLAGRLGRR